MGFFFQLGTEACQLRWLVVAEVKVATLAAVAATVILKMLITMLHPHLSCSPRSATSRILPALADRRRVSLLNLCGFECGVSGQPATEAPCGSHSLRMVQDADSSFALNENIFALVM